MSGIKKLKITKVILNEKATTTIIPGIGIAIFALQFLQGKKQKNKNRYMQWV